jgi:hypothetical protein
MNIDLHNHVRYILDPCRRFATLTPSWYGWIAAAWMWQHSPWSRRFIFTS